MKRSPNQRLLFLLAGSLWLGPWVTHATASSATADEARSPWQVSQSAQISFGYTDNLMLSAFAPQPSAFGQTSADLLLLRATQRGWAFSGFFQGNLRRFQDRDVASRDQSGWFGRVESRWDPLPALSLRANASYFGENSLIDLSESADSRLVVPTRVQGRSATANVRLALTPSLALVVASRPSRNDYRTFAGDFASHEHTARLDLRNNPPGPGPTAGEERRGESVGRRVGHADRLGLVPHGNDRRHRAEDLLLKGRHARAHVAQHGGRVEESRSG